MSKIVKTSFHTVFEPKKVVIFVSCPNHALKKVMACIYDPISVLFHILPIGQKTLFYQGNILQSYKTFEDYGVSDNDRIVIIPTEEITFTTEQFWRNVSKSDIDRKPEIEAIQNPLMKNSIAFQQDLVLFGIESNRQSNRRLIHNFLFLSNESSRTERSTCLNFEKTEHPNENPLPMIW
jgi:hypothetical protein